MFLILLTYKKPLEEIDEFLSAHTSFLDTYYSQKKFIFSGRRNPRTGGVILVNVESLEEMHRIIAEDPFYRNGLADYEIIEFIPSKCNSTFLDFLAVSEAD